MITISGATLDYYTVAVGVGKIVTTHGLPLDIVLQELNRRYMKVDWIDYMQTCLNDGHNPRTILARIESATSDVYGKNISAEIVARAQSFLSRE